MEAPVKNENNLEVQIFLVAAQSSDGPRVLQRARKSRIT